MTWQECRDVSLQKLFQCYNGPDEDEATLRCRREPGRPTWAAWRLTTGEWASPRCSAPGAAA